MSIVSVRLPDDLLSQTKLSCKVLHLYTTKYIHKALSEMNRAVLAEQCKNELRAASLRVRADSMAVNAEFAEIEDDAPI